MDLNVLVRGQSNALLFADRGGAAALEQGLEARLAGVDVHMLYQWGTDTSTIYSATRFMDWDTDGEQASLLSFLHGLSPDLKDNPTATVWMHNEYDQQSMDLATGEWVEAVRADAALVRSELGQGADTTPYEFVPIRYPYGGNLQAITDGMAELSDDPGFNASISWDAQSLAMNGGPESGDNGSHMGDADAVRLGESLAATMADALRPLAEGTSPPPPVVPPPVIMPPENSMAGAGAHALVLRISQDAWQGGAQYTVKVDGVQVGGTFIATAAHGSGDSNLLTLKGDWAAGDHQVSVRFLNDAWGGTPDTDRNLYLDGATYDGAAVPGAARAIMGSVEPGVFGFTAPGGGSPQDPPVSGGGATLSAGSGSDALVLKISQDAYQGAAQYTVKVDGAQVGGVFTAAASHAAGAADTLTVKGDWGPGPHTATVEFLNDAWGGTPDTDRNLYLDGATHNGAVVPGAAGALMSAGARGFAFGDASADGAAPAGPDPAPAPSGGEVDWDAIAAQVLANYNATGHWYF